jgi:hypothetical protein
MPTRTFDVTWPSTQAGKLATVTAQLFDDAEVAASPVYVGTGNAGLGLPAPGDGVIYEVGNGAYALRITFADDFHGTIRWDSGGADPRTATEAVNAGAVDADYVDDAELEAAKDEIIDTINSLHAGDGDTLVDHTGAGTSVPGPSADALAYQTLAGVGVEDADVVAYLASDFAASNYAVRARTKTDVNGRWQLPLALNAGEQYVLYYHKHGEYGPDTTVITVLG